MKMKYTVFSHVFNACIAKHLRHQRCRSYFITLRHHQNVVHHRRHTISKLHSCILQLIFHCYYIYHYNAHLYVTDCPSVLLQSVSIRKINGKRNKTRVQILTMSAKVSVTVTPSLVDDHCGTDHFDTAFLTS